MYLCIYNLGDSLFAVSSNRFFIDLFFLVAIIMPVMMSKEPLKMPGVNFSPRSKLENNKPNTGTSNVEMVAVAISILLIMINQTVKQRADAKIPVKRI